MHEVSQRGAGEDGSEVVGRAGEAAREDRVEAGLGGDEKVANHQVRPELAEGVEGEGEADAATAVNGGELGDRRRS